MPTQPTFLGDGYTPRVDATRRIRWLKILGWYQSQPGANPAFDPKPSDTIRTLKYKVNQVTNAL